MIYSEQFSEDCVVFNTGNGSWERKILKVLCRLENGKKIKVFDAKPPLHYKERLVGCKATNVVKFFSARFYLVVYDEEHACNLENFKKISENIFVKENGERIVVVGIQRRKLESEISRMILEFFGERIEDNKRDIIKFLKSKGFDTIWDFIGFLYRSNRAILRRNLTLFNCLEYLKGKILSIYY